jgi:osmotically inducible protein OsmC
MTFSRSVSVDWQGTIMEGAGIAKAGTGAFALPVTFPRRIGEPEGATSPEELVAAAHATCFAMVIAATLGRKGASVKSSQVTCTVTADKGDAGIKLVSSKLELKVEGLTGMDAATLATTAKEAEGKCPISNALRNNLAIDVETSVV